MDAQNINSEKINLINWITNLQDSSTLERLKEIYLNTTDAIPQWQKDEVLKRVATTPREAYLSEEDFESKLDFTK